ncbi:MAG: cation:proton antiporter [Labilithrix sp.]|nr:cation:proton antiporter [Labilithrix sp.]MCW5811193.1 cation:proton antiporter [Labilithrix sp.]
MNELTILTTFTGGLAAALAFGFVAQRLKIAPIVGYVLAGIVIGPFTPGFVADRHVADQFAEIGVILLLFGVGLRFQLHELFAAWRVAVFGAMIQSAASTLVLAGLLHWLGMSFSTGVVLGMSISVASTVVMVRVLSARGDLRAPIGQIAVAWTVVEDLITVAALLALPMLLGADDGRSAARVFGVAAFQLVALVVAVVVLGKWVIPRVLERIAVVRSRELFTLGVLVIALGLAVGAAHVFNVSMALGAFLAGLAVGRSEFAARAAGDALPTRDAFAVLFFVSVGMLCDPRTIVDSPLFIALIVGVIMVVKPVAAFVVARVLGKPMATSVGIGAALGQVGEFTFILGSVGRALGAIDDTSWNALVAAAIISIALNPTFYTIARRLSGGASKLGKRTGVNGVDPRRCILVGYGPVGRRVHERLQDVAADVTIVELNLETVRMLRASGHDAVYGDALRPTTLEEAQLETAATLVISTELEDAAELVRQARRLNPLLRAFVRCSHLSDIEQLRRVGAFAIAGEGEVAIALAKAVEDGFPLDARPSLPPASTSEAPAHAT